MDLSMTQLHLPVRLRRLRSRAAVRNTFCETRVASANLVQPYFVVPGTGVKRETGPGLWQISSDMLVEECGPLESAGIGGVMLFGVPATKSTQGFASDQIADLLNATSLIANKRPGLVSYADVCLCSYTDTGHCGVASSETILNDASVLKLVAMALELARAGVDFVSPSDMMDGRIGAMRSALDMHQCSNTGIVSYAVKMASAFYGPFRAAASSAPAFGDRKSYQMPAANRREARREWKLDEAEGADALLFKPALTNLDLIRDAREESDLPLFAYQVSGEFAVLRAAADQGLLDFDRAVNESLTSIKRAGADVLITYAARLVATKQLLLT
jgi:porphobilinogen synthase